MVLTKPPYQIASVQELRRRRPKLRAVSTFSGCGGSSTGLRMAGFKPLWANEFIEAARDSYTANWPDTLMCPDDIRAVTADRILNELHLDVGELDLLEGSPPCASFSTAGSRQAGWGQVKSYSDTKQRTDDLFYEFARILVGLQPRAFIAENVSGLVKGTAKGYFKEILAALRACGYAVRAQLLDAQWLGVPQSRERLIFVGIRSDLGYEPEFPRPLPYRYTVRDAIGDHAEQIGTAPPFEDYINARTRNPELTYRQYIASMTMVDADRPSPAVMSAAYKGADLVVVPDTSGLHGAGIVTDRPSPVGGTTVTTDPETGKDLLITGGVIGPEWEKLRPGQSSDRYYMLRRTSFDYPSSTVSASAGGVKTAGVTHPSVPRKFTLGELRRICGFPDDYVLTGTYEQRWERLGRSVPPPLMAAVASKVRDVLCAV